MSDLDRIVADAAHPPLDALRQVPPAAARAVITDARIEVAVLHGAAGAVEQLAIACVEAGDDAAAKACLSVGERLQEGALLAQATLDELMTLYGSSVISEANAKPKSRP